MEHNEKARQKKQIILGLKAVICNYSPDNLSDNNKNNEFQIIPNFVIARWFLAEAIFLSKQNHQDTCKLIGDLSLVKIASVAKSAPSQ